MGSEGVAAIQAENGKRYLADIDTHDRSGLLDEIEERKIKLQDTLRKNHHGQDCIVCFERKCVCKPRN